MEFRLIPERAVALLSPLEAKPDYEDYLPQPLGHGRSLHLGKLREAL